VCNSLFDFQAFMAANIMIGLFRSLRMIPFAVVAKAASAALLFLIIFLITTTGFAQQQTLTPPASQSPAKSATPTQPAVNDKPAVSPPAQNSPQPNTGVGTPAAKSAAPAVPRDQVIVAKVNGIPIKYAEFEPALKAMVANRSIDAAAYEVLQAETVEALIGRKLMMSFLAMNKKLATEAEVESQLQTMRQKLKTVDVNATLEDTIAERGLSMVEFREWVVRDLSFRKYITDFMKPEILEEYFKKHKTEFDGSRIHVKHIILRPLKNGDAREIFELKEKGTTIREEIVGGKITFEDAVKKYSMGPSRRNEGDLGFIGREGPMDEAFSNAAFGIGIGEITKPVVTPFGVHLIKVAEIEHGTKSFEEVKKRVTTIFPGAMSEKIIAEMREKAIYEFHPAVPHYDPMTKKLIRPNKDETPKTM
jgi:parvulin-like peptidyl-prolyl isomerase